MEETLKLYRLDDHLAWCVARFINIMCIYTWKSKWSYDHFAITKFLWFEPYAAVPWDSSLGALHPQRRSPTWMASISSIHRFTVRFWSEDVSLVCKREVVRKVWNNLKRTELLQCTAGMENLNRVQLNIKFQSLNSAIWSKKPDWISFFIILSYSPSSPYQELKQDLRESKASVAVDGPPSDLETDWDEFKSRMKWWFSRPWNLPRILHVECPHQIPSANLGALIYAAFLCAELCRQSKWVVLYCAVFGSVWLR